VASGRAPWRVILSDELSSTNRRLGELAPLADERLCVVAEHQTAGRGRRGRSFADVPGGALLVSSLHRFEAPREPVLLAAAVGIAAVRTARRLGVASAAWGWPNDVVVGEAKLGGVLIEASWQAGLLSAVVGFGLNLAAHPDLADRSLAAVRDVAGREVGREEALGCWLDELERLLAAWLEGGPIVTWANELLAWRGEAVLVRRAGDELSGRLERVSERGALVLGLADGSVEVDEAELVRLVRTPGVGPVQSGAGWGRTGQCAAPWTDRGG
jgi:BirA family biotin operon repressor/biotin-[acetyl-CoA-carboxylase] ligase